MRPYLFKTYPFQVIFLYEKPVFGSCQSLDTWIYTDNDTTLKPLTVSEICR